MAIGDLLPQRALHRRRSTAVISQSAWPFTVSTAWSTASPVRLKLNGTGLSGSATVSITGLIDATPQNESVLIPATTPQIAITTKRWTSVTQLVSAGTPTGTLLVEGIEQGGMPILSDATVTASLPCRLRQRTQRQDQVETGTVLDEIWTLYTERDVLLPFDLLDIDGVTYTVDNVYRMLGKTTYHHTEALVRRLPSPL